MTEAIVGDGLSYNPVSGVFLWDKPSCYKIRKGQIAGSFDKDGYIKLHWRGKRVFAHRLAWLLVHGVWPQHHIDHINGVKDDNRICNLRLATRSQNGANRAGWRSGLKGACFHKASQKWQAKIRSGGRAKHLGLFDTEKEAHAAYVEAASRIHGEFARVE